MSTLKLYLFGSPHLVHKGDLINVPRRKALALLAYLAVTGREHRREKLATLLWPDSDAALAYSYLRRDLAVLNRALGAGRLDVDRDVIGLAQSDDFWLDVTQFLALVISCRTHGHATDEVCPQCMSPLSEAVALYQGDFMAGFSLPDSEHFDEWQRFESEALRRELAGAFRSLVHGHSAQGEFDIAIACARRWLALDVWHEPAHRQLMLLCAWAGNSSAALRQYRECVHVLEEELGQPPDEATRELSASISSGRIPPPPSWDERPSSGPVPPWHNLPPQSTPIIGREAVLAAIGQLLRDPDCRMLTLVGPGGIGKTRLALEAAARALDDFSHGVYLVTLASIGSADLLVPTIADTLRLSFHGRTDAKDQLLNYVREKTLLLVIDSFEHLLDGVDLLAEVLHTAPYVKLLVTSRERLNLSAEWVWEVEGLSFPNENAKKNVQEIMSEEYGAITLFVESVHRVCPHLHLSEEDRVAVARICQLVEGMPLGVEMAAAWARMMPVSEIAGEIERDFDFLATSLRDVPARHRSLRALFEHSWQLLTEGEQTAVMRLSTFRGGFGRDAAQWVAGAPLPMLVSLVDKSMLRAHPSGRYDMHELLRQFVMEKQLDTPPEHQEAHDRHSRCYAHYLQERESRLRGSEQYEALAEIAAEIDNVREAWQWAVAHKLMAEIGQALESLYFFYFERGWVQEGEAAFRDAVANWCSTVTADELVIGRLLARQGRFTYRLGHHREAKDLLHKSLDIFSRLETEEPLAVLREKAFSLFSMSVILRGEGAYGEAQRLCEESLAIYQQVGDLLGMAMALKQLGIIGGSLGRYQDAQERLQQALALYHEIGDAYGIANTLNDLGVVAVWLDQQDEAQRLYQECLALRQQLGDLWGIGTSLNNLGYLAYLGKAYAEAEHLLDQSLVIQRQIGDRYHIANCLNNLGCAASALGEIQKAILTFFEALSLAAEIGADPLVLEVLVGIATSMAKGVEKGGVQAAGLLAFACHHPASDEPTKARAQHGLAEVEVDLPPEMLAEAHTWASGRDLRAVVADVLSWEKAGWRFGSR